MENIKAALLRDVEAARNLLNSSNAMEALGYPNNPFWTNYMNVADGIYKLIGEKTDTFEESITYLALNAPYLTNERRVEMLMAEYNKNFPKQPRPVTSETDNKARAGYTFKKSMPDSYVNPATVTYGRQQDKVTPT